MKVLLFTHSQDIDGMGCAVLGHQAFDDITVVPTKTFEITSNVKKYMDCHEIENYDQIFVTDLCIKEPVLKEIDENENLKSKLFVIDHHKTEIEEGNNKYEFVHIFPEIDGKKESGTSLFYQYLLKKGHLKATAILDEFVEWTRQYDVWDWKKEKNDKARYLHILFEHLGHQKYVEMMNEKVRNHTQITFNEFETGIIETYLDALERDIREFVEKMKVVILDIHGTSYKVGYVRCLYKYRNDVNEFLMQEGSYDIDMVGMITTDMDSTSYRQIKNVDVSVVATYFGGKGHFAAASNPQSNEAFQKMLKENGI